MMKIVLCPIKRNVLTVLFLFTIFVQAFADVKISFIKDGFTYSILKYPNGDSYLAVTGYQADSATDYSQPLHIPSSATYEGKIYNVEEIAPKAFKGVTNIQSVVIEEGIKRICNDAFWYCVNLKSIYIPATVDCLGVRIFASCYSLTSVVVDANNETFDSRDSSNAIIFDDELVVACSSTVIPSSVKSIGEWAFYNCNMMEHLVIPEGVETIGAHAFYGCSSLRSISLPESLTKIGWSAFEECSSLTSIVIPKNVTKIDNHNLFTRCFALISIQVDNANPCYDSRSGCNGIVRKSDSALVAACGTTTIGDDIRVLESNCFDGTVIHSIYIPKSVENVSGSAFVGCYEIEEITVAPDHPNFISPKGSNALLTKDGKTLLVGCRTTVIPAGVETIGDYAFFCRYIKPVLYLPDTIRKIGDTAFSNCNGLYEVIIPKSVEIIEPYAFSDCRNLTVVQMLSPVKTINDSTFNNCYSLSTLSFPEDIKI